VDSYGIERLWGRVELAHFTQNITVKNETKPLKVTSWISFDSMESGDKGLFFRTPIGRSFLCQRVDDFGLISHLHYSFPDAPEAGIKWENWFILRQFYANLVAG